MSKGLVCVPHTGLFHYQFLNSFVQLLFASRPIVDQLDYQLRGSCLIYDAREQAADYMLEQGHDWLFFLDSDMEPRPDIIANLLKLNKPIASAMAFKRIEPYSPCFYPNIEVSETGEVKAQFVEDWTPGIARVDGVGMACCLIRREVFENTPKPWFRPDGVLAEDLSFCLRAKKAGFETWIDTRQVCGHIATKVITEVDFRAWRDAQKESAGIQIANPILEVSSNE